MKILALERAGTAPWPDEQRAEALLREEAKRAWDLYQAGAIREMYFRSDRQEAVLILECGSEAEAREVLASLPLVREALIDFEVAPLVPYPGFARLFS